MESGEFDHLVLDSMGLNSVGLERLAQELYEAGEVAFCQQYDCPFLVLLHGPTSDGDWIGLNTSEASIPRPKDLGSRLQGVRAIPLVKTDRNAFGAKVTVGRARNNDVIIRAPKVSKFHAAFFPLRGGGFQLQDMGSLNGTVVNGERLKRKEKAPLKTGDLISFWRFVFKYVSLPDLVERLKVDGQPVTTRTLLDE